MTYKTQRWINATGPLHGHHAFVRKNISIASANTADYPYTLMLSLAYTIKSDKGVPCDPDELGRLARTEEAIADAFVSAHDALFGLVVSSDGAVDIFLFLPREIPDADAEALIQSTAPEVDYQFEVIHDPAWTPYRDINPEEE